MTKNFLTTLILFSTGVTVANVPELDPKQQELAERYKALYTDEYIAQRLVWSGERAVAKRQHELQKAERRLEIAEYLGKKIELALVKEVDKERIQRPYDLISSNTQNAGAELRSLRESEQLKKAQDFLEICEINASNARAVLKKFESEHSLDLDQCFERGLEHAKFWSLPREAQDSAQSHRLLGR